MILEKVRLENVDIIEVLQFVVDNNTSNYMADFEYDKNRLISVGGIDKSEHFLWLSRNSGTWMFPESEVFFTGTAAYNTWTNYSEKNDRVKAFMVEVERTSDGRAYGNVTELDYEKHLDYLVKYSENPKEVQLIFKDSMRNFSLQEYNHNSEAITNRYGPIEKRTFLPEQEYFFLSKVWEARKEFTKDTVVQDFGYYKFNFRDLQFIEYGYHAQDREFVNSKEADQILKNGFTMYALKKDGSDIPITTLEEYNKLQSKDVLFCTDGGTRAFIKHLESNTPPLFSDNELEVIYECVTTMGTDNKIYDIGSANDILSKIEILSPQFLIKMKQQEQQVQDLERE